MKTPTQIVEAILGNLNDRKGFDDWWDNIDGEIQQEIREELTKIVEEATQP